MAELISRCASLRAAGEPGDGEAWVDAARALGGEPDRRRDRRGAPPPRAGLERSRARYDPGVIFDAASDGMHIILGDARSSGLVFLAVIALGELVKAPATAARPAAPARY